MNLKVDVLNLNNVKKAFAIANNAIYFDDSSDYFGALWDICKALNPELEDEKIGKMYIDENIE